MSQPRFHYGWRTTYGRTPEILSACLPISGRWAEVKQILIKEVILEHIYKLAMKIRLQHKPLPEFYKIKGELCGLGAKLCSSADMPFSEMIALPFLGPDDVVPINGFILLHREPASRGLLSFAQKHYQHKFPQIRRGAPSVAPSSHVELTAREVAALSLEEQSVYMAQCATAAHNAQPEIYAPVLFSLEKEEAHARELQALEEARCPSVPDERRRTPIGIPYKDLRPARTEAEQRQAMITADGHLVVLRSVTYR